MTRQGIRGALVVVLPAWVTARLLVGMGWLVAEMIADGDTKTVDVDHFRHNRFAEKLPVEANIF